MTGVSENYLDWMIEHALKEDVGSGDHTSRACISPDQKARAILTVKEIGVIAGVSFAKRVFESLDPESEFTLKIEDGKDVYRGDIVFQVDCNARTLLKAERFVLNVMQRMSGIATMSSRFAVEVEGLEVTILDTRKTTPLLRPLEKWAVRIGGCQNYRNGLDDRIMIKDNHINSCGSIAHAIGQVQDYLKEKKLDLEITIEVKNLVELYEVLEAGNVHRIMLDNFDLPILKEAAAIAGNRFELEASGRVNLKNVRKIAETGVHFISVGALTHSAGCLDLSLKVIEKK